MKFKIFYKVFTLAFLAFLLQSRSGGPAAVINQSVTGAPISDGNKGTCANTGCHMQGNFDGALTFELLDDGTAVTQYEPGKSYILRLNIMATSGTPAAYGFQTVALDDADAQAGSWGNVGTDHHTVNLNNRVHVEQSKRLTENVIEMEWIAPAAGTGAVTFYSAALLSNANGNSLGDTTVSGSMSVNEKDPSSTNDLFREFANISIYPNPVETNLTLQISSRTSGAFQVRLVDLSGKVIRIEPVTLLSGANSRSFDVSGLEKGLYMVQLFGKDHVATAQMLKI
ncbi:MAG: T9SS C-terminal target domain-containing protein [Bacteroidetes bacterium]|nr:MAG: T9SS C-terminal target domain-containing protein [Bacteroidota bacterium]